MRHSPPRKEQAIKGGRPGPEPDTFARIRSVLRRRRHRHTLARRARDILRAQTRARKP